MAIKELSADHLKRKISSGALPFKTTDEISPLHSIIGQERALTALRLGLEIDASGYNVFVTGISGTGRTTIIEDILHSYSRKAPTPDDWCYVYNFVEPDLPQAISLPAGKGREFQHDMQQLILTLKQELRRVFTSEHYESQKASLISQINQAKRQILQELDAQAAQLHLQIQPTSMGFQTVVLEEGQPITPEIFQSLPEERKKEINQNLQFMEKKIAETLRQLARLDIKAQQSLQQLDKDVAGFVVEQYVNDIREEYQDNKAILNYLQNVCKDIVSNSARFLGDGDREPAEEEHLSQDGYFRRYQINVLVDNSRLKGAPVIYEKNPTYNNLFGRIEKVPVSGGYVTDFTLIKAGSLLKANGGFLMADAAAVMRSPFCYDALKRSLRNKEIRIEDANELFGTFTVVSLKPEPIPLKLKVILVGWSRIYHVLSNYDDDFSKIFKVRADFDYETESNNRSIRQFAQFIKRVIDQEKLPVFTREAVAEVVQYGHRMAGGQEKLSLQFGEVVKIIQQAAYWARKASARVVDREYVQQAIREYESRHSLINSKMLEQIRKERKKIFVTGERVGEINGLSVISFGEFSFGKPSRITAKTYIGNDNFFSIERKVGLSGKLHDKGTFILSGFFNSIFGTHIPLSFSASLTFEQSYGHIDGDSASSTELYVLLSSLSGIPIKQGIAVTGSVNQNGEIQAIGGVNEKIEGFFEVCQVKGLTGEQGVMIPRSNIKNLLLKDEVVQAVQEGKFHIWAVDRIEDGLKLLTGKPAGKRNKKGHFPKNSIYGKVEERLREFAERSEKYRKSIGNSNKGKSNNSNGKNANNGSRGKRTRGSGS